MGTLVWLDFAASLITASSGALFMAGYAVLAPWYRSTTGWFLMTYAGSVAGLALNEAVRILRPDWSTWTLGFRSGLTIVLGVLFWQQALTLIRIQFKS